MKKAFLFISAACLYFTNTHAQWQQQNSPTSNTLNSVCFANAKTGFAVGANGTIIKTTNGGNNWQVLESPTTNDLVSVYLSDTSNVFITSSNALGNPSVYKSVNGGQSWTIVLSDFTPFYITGTANGKLFSVSRNIYESDNLGNSWTNRSTVNSTTSYNHISFANNSIGMCAGNISGILTYSADFKRSNDGGANWYPSDPFKFPNANGFTAMNSLSPDSVFMFTNYYKGFGEGDSSQLILLNNFRLFSKQNFNQWEFKSIIVVKSFPDKIRACRFFTSSIAYAAGDKGIIYISKNGGKNWKADYKGSTSIKSIFMFDENRGFAVGDKGIILKRLINEPSQPTNTSNKIINPVLAEQ